MLWSDHPFTKMDMAKALQVLSDDQGTVIAGYLAVDVYYVRLADYISSGLGIEIASQLRKHLGDAAGVTCFFDVALVQGGDFAARSAIARALLANRRQVTSITTLVPIGSIPMRARARFGRLRVRCDLGLVPSRTPDARNDRARRHARYGMATGEVKYLVTAFLN